MTHRDKYLYRDMTYKIFKILYCDIEMTSLKHMFWMEILSTGVCIAISTLLQYD